MGLSVGAWSSAARCVVFECVFCLRGMHMRVTQHACSTQLAAHSAPASVAQSPPSVVRRPAVVVW